MSTCSQNMKSGAVAQCSFLHRVCGWPASIISHARTEKLLYHQPSLSPSNGTSARANAVGHIRLLRRSAAMRNGMRCPLCQRVQPFYNTQSSHIIAAISRYVDTKVDDNRVSDHCHYSGRVHRLIGPNPKEHCNRDRGDPH